MIAIERAISQSRANYWLGCIVLPWFWATLHSFASIGLCRIVHQRCRAILCLFASIKLCRIKQPCCCGLFCTRACFAHGLMNCEFCVTSSWPWKYSHDVTKIHRVQSIIETPLNTKWTPMRTYACAEFLRIKTWEEKDKNPLDRQSPLWTGTWSLAVGSFQHAEYQVRGHELNFLPF